jgi:hypothetical protein
MDDEGLGFRFYAGMAGIVVACGIAILIFIVIFDWAAYTWGIFGALLALAAALLAVAWITDRRKIREYEAE